MDLIAVATLTAVIAPLLAVAGLPDAARAALGLPFVLSFPGYALVSAVFPRHGWPGAVERLALSGVTSLAIVPLIGIALNYSPWGLRAESVLAFVGLFIVAISVLGLAHRATVPPGQRFDPGIGRLAAAVRNPIRLAYPIAAASVAAAAIAATALSLPQIGQRGTTERFTEFYLLGADGTAEGYPATLDVGAPATVTLGIANQEGESAVYTASVFVNDDPVAEYRSIRLHPGQRLERPVSFSLRRAGDDQVVRFDLHKDGRSEPYRSLHLRLDGRQAAKPRPASVEPGPAAADVLPRSATPVAAAPEGPPEATPPPPQPPPPVEPPAPIVHIVSTGENLTRIAGRYGLSLAELLAVNYFPNPDLIFPAQSIFIPPSGGTDGQ